MAPAGGLNAALQCPIFGAVAPWLSRLPAGRFPSCAELNDLLDPRVRSGGGTPIRFVPCGTGEPYEMQIHDSGRVPTRAENWHDLFNALAWLAFPLTKAVLNHRHYLEMQRPGAAPGRRGTARDVLTLFDEGGVIVASTDPALLELLRAFRWKPLFWDRRAEVVRAMRFFVFGHAILEKALAPYKGVTAKSLLLQVPASFPHQPQEEQLVQADRLASQWFSRDDALRSTRNLSPLPVLAVPGWADNGNARFYEDAAVFRAGYGNAGTVGSRP